jgi:hypothetical protein|tara:strand:+ start:402 stop:1139 length:738 start_codon:yes stop_codon:yes gene_type:complete
MSVMDIYGINRDMGPGGIDASLPNFDLSIPSDIPGMTRPAINFRDAPVNFMMRQNNPRVFDPMVNIKNFAQNLPTNVSTGLSKTFDIGKTVGSGIVSALTGLPGVATALGLFNETPEQKALREFYEATTGLTSTGQIASGIMQGYNPVSGFGPQGLTAAIDKRIGTIKNTLKNKKSAILEARLKELEAIKAAEAKARMDAFEKSGRRAEVRDLQSRIDRGDFDGPGGPGASAAANQDAARGGQYG